MHLLQGGVAPEIIALWLGHESPNTTHLYVEADLMMKRQALDGEKGVSHSMDSGEMQGVFQQQFLSLKKPKCFWL